MGAAKYWLIFLMLAMAIVVESGTVPFDDPAGTWSLTGDHNGNNGFDFESELLMDSETNHRLLAQRRGRYISYNALRKDSVPCNRRGRSYYNCNGRQKANPYRRGCSAITKCRRVTR